MPSEYYRLPGWQTRLESIGHSLGVVFAAFVGGVFLALTGRGLLELAGFTRELNPILVPVAITVLQFVGFILVAVGYVVWRDTSLFEFDVPSLKDVGFIVAGFVALFLVSSVLGYVIQRLGAQTAENQVITFGRDNPEFFLYMMVVTLLVQAPAEELLFRGVVQGLFRKAYGILPGVVLTAVVFGIIHFFALQGGGKLVYISIAVALGLVLGTLYELTENLTVPALTHGLWNAFLFAINFAAATMEVPGFVWIP